MIHETAVVSKKAKLGKNVKIGPYCIIGDEAELGDEVELKSHVIIDCPVTIGKKTVIYPFASINQTQDLKYSGEPSTVIIGENNTIREYVTIQRGTKSGGMVTKIGDNNLLMLGVHVAHDCILGNNIIISNNVSLSGHVRVDDYAVIGGHSAVQQFVRIGAHSMIGGMSAIMYDLIPFGLAVNERANLDGLNMVGMKRRGFDKKQTLDALSAIKDILSRNKRGEELFAERINRVEAEYQDNGILKQIIDFIREDEKRNYCTIK